MAALPSPTWLLPTYQKLLHGLMLASFVGAIAMFVSKSDGAYVLWSAWMVVVAIFFFSLARSLQKKSTIHLWLLIGSWILVVPTASLLVVNWIFFVNTAGSGWGMLGYLPFVLLAAVVYPWYFTLIQLVPEALREENAVLLSATYFLFIVVFCVILYSALVLTHARITKRRLDGNPD